MPDLDDLTRAELKALVTALSDRKDEQAYDPDSLMAMMLASPKKSRAISWRMQHPATRTFIVIFCLFVFLGLLIALFVIFSVGL